MAAVRHLGFVVQYSFDNNASFN